MYEKLNYKSIGIRISEVRKKADESQEDFAERFDLNQADISRIEKGAVKPSAEFLFNLCRQYNVSLEWLLVGYESSEKEAAISDPDLKEIFEWLNDNPDEKHLVLKLMRGKKDVREAIEGLKFLGIHKIIVKH